ncbi:dipeptidase [Portibacter marinus]|uniref:dipeptidase n=1 Tax=Portibacter marinus TaxID=2898660 RepID=UPI001F3A36D7|nr:membrane dipeptidase [Portibacter marinus]
MASQLIIDGHLDLSMNAMQWNRDLRMPIDRIRLLEEDQSDKPDRGNGVVSFSEMRRGNIFFCIATLIARYAKPSHPLGGWNSPEQAWATVQGQIAWYLEMERQGELKQIKSYEDFQTFMSHRDQGSIGYLMSLEGADSIVDFDHLYQLHDQGLRAIGPAHYGPGTYAYGTNSEGSIGHKGRELLKKMDELKIVLDVTHLCDTSFWESLDHYNGVVWASHSNTRSLVPHNRQFSDEQIRALIDRNAVIGQVLDAWMMVPDWTRGVSTPKNTSVTLSDMIDHMDHICQIAGNTDHIAIGSDLDGGFGTEQCPSDINTIADLSKIPTLLENRGYSQDDIQKIMHGNWQKIIGKALKESFDSIT